jgi:hypothetical protein
MFVLAFIVGTTVAYYKEITAVFIMPYLGNFIQDFDKNDPQSNINLDTFKKSNVKFQKNLISV